MENNSGHWSSLQYGFAGVRLGTVEPTAGSRRYKNGGVSGFFVRRLFSTSSKITCRHFKHLPRPFCRGMPFFNGSEEIKRQINCSRRAEKPRSAVHLSAYCTLVVLQGLNAEGGWIPEIHFCYLLTLCSSSDLLASKISNSSQAVG